jgi:hypothetical protein
MVSSSLDHRGLAIDIDGQIYAAYTFYPVV